MKQAWVFLSVALALAGCGTRGIAGDYNMVNGPSPGVVATFGEKTYALSSGASGEYEISGDSAILSGSGIAGSYKIDGDKLVGPRWTFVKRSPDDKTPINHGPRGGSFIPSGQDSTAER